MKNLSFAWRKNYVSSTWFKREEKEKATFSPGENERETDCVLMRKEH